MLARGGDNFGEEVTTREVEGHRQQHRCGKGKRKSVHDTVVNCVREVRPGRNLFITIVGKLYIYLFLSFLSS